MNGKIMSAVLIAILATSVASAKKEKTITYGDSLLTDNLYGYSVRVTENWKVKGFNEPSIERAFLEKKNYSVNREIQTYGGDYTIPTINIFVQEFNGTLDDFEALLKKSLDEHQSDNEIIRKLGLLRDSELAISGNTEIDSLPARLVMLKRNYKRLLAGDPYGRSSSPATQTEKYINDHEVHQLFLIKKDTCMIVFQAYCEREFYGKENKDEFEAMAMSLKFKRAGLQE